MRLNRILFFLCSLSVSVVYAQDRYGMIPVKVEGPKEKYEIESMPRVRSQDSLGLCYSFSAATLIDRQTCVDKGVANCETMPDELEVSPIDVSRFNNTPPPGADRNDRENYSGVGESGSLNVTLENAVNSGQIVSEACAPFHQIVAKNQDPKKRAELELSFWKRLKDLHAKSKQSSGCTDCEIETATAIDKFRQDFSLKASNEEILRAFAQDSFANFLDQMLVPEECRFDGLAEINPKYKVSIFPEADLPTSSSTNRTEAYIKMIGKIKTVLKDKKVPMGLSFCAQQGQLTFSSMDECSPGPNATSTIAGYAHAVVISGYRRVCKNDGSGCYDALKIQNSWGKQWQEENNDGWVDAEELMKRTFYKGAALTWLEKQPQ